MEMIDTQAPDLAGTQDPLSPTWDELREGGCMVVDGKFQQLAVYPGDGGHVVIASADAVSDGPHFIVIERDDMPKFIAALTKTQGEAAERWAAIEQEIEAITAAMGDVASGEVGSHH
ncbi:hypothetical protein [Variovorax sp. RA8]|uniref:hypothetical protein n=1 Tax=Variovorax sp. (strain JCM 16519 / RA8) TaxID=662548 RepID=UPI0013A578F7|nr:hypothetical protein [Variovorax sp. RA8]